jgi:uncharacterized phage protein (TIGR02218 family)
MTYSTLENSVDGGKPIELLRLSYSNVDWFYTSGDTPRDYGGATYVPMPMQRSDLENSSDSSKSSMTITLPQDCPIADLYKVSAPSNVVSVTLMGEHYLDNEFITMWKGRIVNVEFVPPHFVITTESVFTSLQRNGLRRRFSTTCTYDVYSAGCGKDHSNYVSEMMIGSLAGTTFISAQATAYVDNYFAGGYVKWINPTTGLAEYRAVKSSVQATGAVTLVSIIPNITVGSMIEVYPGCDHLLSTCQNKFGNIIRFGGTPFIPKKNPFGGTSIF